MRTRTHHTVRKGQRENFTRFLQLPLEFFEKQCYLMHNELQNSESNGRCHQIGSDHSKNFYKHFWLGDGCTSDGMAHGCFPCFEHLQAFFVVVKSNKININ